MNKKNGKKIKKIKKLNNEIIVGKEDEINTISKALKIATNNSKIKIKSGLYIEKLNITKKVTLMPKEEIGEVILISNSGSAIFIDVPDNGKVIIKNLKIGLTLSEKLIKENFSKNEILDNLLEEKENKYNKNDPYNPLNHFVNNIEINDDIDCIINIKNGLLNISECILTLKTLQNTIENIIPICISYNNSKLNLKKCTLSGHESNPSLGILIKEGNLKLENSTIENLNNGGILIFNNEKDDKNVLIDHNKFHENLNFSIEILGKNKNVLIKKNIIEKCYGVGIQCGVLTQVLIEECIIRSNFYGIRLISCQSNIINNKIKGNKFEGIQSITYKGFVNNSIIKKNSIERNLSYGILIEGKNNFTIVSCNLNISENFESGVCVKLYSFPKIFKNEIFLNEKQGILLLENSQALIEDNKIYKNIKANIALGGLLSENTIIKNNKIYESTAEGIFIMLGSACIIYHNIIHSNYEGIIVYESSPDIKYNKIYNNKNQGVLLINGSKPFLNFNKIINNEGVGLFIKDKSNGIIFKNELENNEINLCIENYHYNYQELIKLNSITNNICISEKPNCIIF